MGLKVVQLGANKGNDDLFDFINDNYDEIEFGLFVEANSFHIYELKKCYEKYDNIFIENVAIKIPSQNKDTLEIFYHTNEHPNYGIASCDIEHLKKHMVWCPHLQGGEIKSFEVSCISLDNLLQKYSVHNLDILFLDLEGIDAEVLLTLDWEKYSIKRVEFESLHLGNYENALKYMFCGMGYEQVNSLHEYNWAFEKKIISKEFLNTNKNVKEINKLQNFPTVNFISIEESDNRRENLYKQFEKYGIQKVVPHIFERYDKTKHIVHSTEWWAKDKEGYLGATTSHLKAIKTWYETTDEPYAFFCEDDISFETIDYWNFTWEEFFNSLPNDWSCIQFVLSREDMFKFFQPEVHFRNRCWCDWAATGYLITRSHAKKLLENYYNSGVFFLEYKGNDKDVRDEWATHPTTETILFSNFGNPVYVFPLFVENPNFNTTVWDLTQEVPQFHWPCYNAIIDWWKDRGSKMTLNDLFSTIRKNINADKLRNFPPINFISIKESEDRRNLLYQKLDRYGFTNVTPHIFDRYADEDHQIIGADAHLVTGSGRGPLTSHLKAIKTWYETTDEPYAFFCEDDISFETIDYWNFTWQEFFDSLPSDWNCVQLSWIRDNMFQFSPDGLKLRTRCWCDWSCCAYLITREHAESLISSYFEGDAFVLEYKGVDRNIRPETAYRPVAETLIYSNHGDINLGPVYGFPLFVEDYHNCSSSLTEDRTDYAHVYSHDTIINWWRKNGKKYKPQMDKKLKDFPSINFISIEECSDRRELLTNKLEELKLKFVPHIFEKYKDEDHIITGLDSGLLLGAGRGPLTSHLKAIKTWYETTDEPYAFFCEDDISFDSVQYWNFTWQEFFDRLPSNWECVQLSLTREFYKEFNIEDFVENIKHNLSHFFKYDFHMRHRCWCDWSCVGYMIKRSHAKKLLDAYYSDNSFCLEYKGVDRDIRPQWAYKPVAETIIHTLFDWSTVYTFPLFVENSGFETTLSPDTNYLCVRNTCSDTVMDWWKTKGKDFLLDQIINESLLN